MHPLLGGAVGAFGGSAKRSAWGLPAGAAGRKDAPAEAAMGMTVHDWKQTYLREEKKSKGNLAPTLARNL